MACCERLRSRCKGSARSEHGSVMWRGLRLFCGSARLATVAPWLPRKDHRHGIVVEIVALRVGRHAALRFLRASHGAIVASMADPLNSRSARHITLRCSDLALRLPRERNRAEQAMIAWQQRAGPSERSQGRKPAEPVARSASLDGAPLVRQRSPMRSWRASTPSMRNTTLRCERWRSER